MSVTFMFVSDTTSTDKFDCMMCDINGETDDCTKCHGAGFIEFRYHTHEVQMSNANAGYIMESLGFAWDYVGSVPTVELFAAARAALEHTRDPFLTEYFTLLLNLCRAAMKAGDDTIHWG